MGAKDLRTGEQAEHRVREILAEYGLDYKKNPDKRAIDLVSPGLPSIEVKSKGYLQLGMRTDLVNGEYRISHHDFQISGPIDPTIGIPTLRPGDVLRSFEEDPTSLWVLLQQERTFRSKQHRRTITMPERLYFFRSSELAQFVHKIASRRRLTFWDEGLKSTLKIDLSEFIHLRLSTEEAIAYLKSQPTTQAKRLPLFEIIAPYALVHYIKKGFSITQFNKLLALDKTLPIREPQYRRF